MTEIEINKEKEKIQSFLSLTETKIKLTEQVRKYYGKEIAPDFNSFNFWRMDENKVSEILAFFLDPNESHEQGDIYLKHFLKKFDLNFFQFTESDKIDVKCEFNTDNGRRIDIIIKKNEFEQAIAIENKIYVWTKDQQDQISDYADFLKRQTDEKEDKFCLIYLSPQDKTISDYSISPDYKVDLIKGNKLKLLTYEEHIIDCIYDFCNLTQNIRVKSFLKDFEKKLRKIYMGEDNLNKEAVVTDLIMEKKENFEISFSIANSFQKNKNQLKEKFKQQIQEIGEELNIVVDIKSLSLIPSNWKKNKIRFNYEMGGLIYGLQRNEPDITKPEFSEIEEIIKSKINENFEESPFEVSDWWSMWRFFYSDIEKNYDFWDDIKNGIAKKRAKTFIEIINDKFNSNKY